MFDFSCHMRECVDFSGSSVFPSPSNCYPSGAHQRYSQPIFNLLPGSQMRLSVSCIGVIFFPHEKHCSLAIYLGFKHPSGPMLRCSSRGAGNQISVATVDQRLRPKRGKLRRWAYRMRCLFKCTHSGWVPYSLSDPKAGNRRKKDGNLHSVHR